MYKSFTAVGTSSLFCCFVLSGCFHFDKADFSGAEKGTMTVALIPQLERDRPLPENFVKSQLTLDSKLEEAFKSSCLLEGRPIVPVAATFIIAAAKFGFDWYMDAQIRAQEQLKKAAQASYSERMILFGENLPLQRYGCALIVRGPKEDKPAEFLALIHFDALSDKSFLIQPLYIKLAKAVAITSKNPKTESDADEKSGETESEGSKKPSINVSIAISVKALVTQQSGATSLAPIGEGAFSVPNLKLGHRININGKSDQFQFGAPITCPAVCPTSDIIAYPQGDGPVSITFSVTETGNVGVDFDKRTAELKAIKEAFGPAIQESLKEVLQ